jgi:hypothetical protein
MKTNFPSSEPSAASVPALAHVDLDQADAVQWARALPQSAALHVDCGRLKCQRTLGVAHVVSQLLLLRRAGVTVWLRNANAPLRYCLRVLNLGRFFRLIDPA